MDNLNKVSQATRVCGEVFRLRDGVALVRGLTDAFRGEVVFFERGLGKGLVMRLSPGIVGVIVLTSSNAIKPGLKVLRTGKTLSVAVGKTTLGCVVDAIGSRILHVGSVAQKLRNMTVLKENNLPSFTRLLPERPVELRAPGIIPRASVCEPLHTGIRIVDSLVPLGRGQRELIIGDRQIGKTTIAIDAILNQKRNNSFRTVDGFGDKRLFCIYVAIGQKGGSIRTLQGKLEDYDAYWYSSIVAAPSNGVASTKYIAPYTGTARGEYYRDNGLHAVIIYDDLSKHADAYRQRSLLLRNTPGREAYPGDIFYAHSRLLERAAKMSRRYGYGSLTALPVIETQSSDVSAYIATNVISITDGQIFLDKELFARGIKPALSVGTSVSRVGSKAQTSMRKFACGSLKSDLAQYREVEFFSKFSDDFDETVTYIRMRGKLSTLLRVQPHSNPRAVEKQVFILRLLTNNLLDNLFNPEEVQVFVENIFKIFAILRFNYVLHGLFILQNSKLDEKYIKYCFSRWNVWLLGNLANLSSKCRK